MEQPSSWSHLPDVCLLLIFKELSVSDMIRSVGRVCTNWGKVQRVELRNRNTLVIATEREMGNEEILEQVRQYSNPFGSNLIDHVRRENGLPWAQLRPLDQIKFDTLRMPSDVFRTEGFTSLVMDTLPNITHLTLVMYVPLNLIFSSLQQLTRLISHYTTRLVSLKLDFECNFPAFAFRINPEILVPLFNSINRLKSLQHLRLDIKNLVDSYPELSILSRLTTFTSGSNYPDTSLLASLRKYATNGDDHLRVECCPRMEFNDLMQLDPQLATKFTRLSQVNVEFDQSLHNDIRLFCHRFVSLHTLGLTITGMSMTVLAQYLSQLPELINLDLYLEESFHPLLPDGEEVEEEGEEEDLAQPEIVQVPTVRLLTLTMVISSYHDTQRFHLHQIFPNLQVLHFHHETSGCDECHYDYEGFDALELDEIQPELQTQIVHCMHLARQPFRQCANLHTVKLDSDDTELWRLLPRGLLTRDQL